MKIRVILVVAMLSMTACAGGGAVDSGESAFSERQTITADRTQSDTSDTGGVTNSEAMASIEPGGTTPASSVPSATEFQVVEEIPSRIERPVTTQAPVVDDSTSSTAQEPGERSSISSETESPPERAATVVTTVPGSSGGIAALYKGYLGTLDRNTRIVDPLGPPPAVAAGIQPLTGLVGPVPNRPAAIVKVDNSSAARPQSGLNAADIVVEEEVEGGVTRFAVVFHSTSSTVGPVRSARTTDIGIMNSFGSPLLMYSGANEVTEGIIRAQPTVQNRNAGTSSGYWRSSSRRAPSNLYTDTADHWASATSGPPPAQFSYRPEGQGVAPDNKTAVSVNQFSVAYRASTAGWSWNGAAWLRTQGGSPHLTSSGQQVSAANVVVIEAREVSTGMVDSTGANVPEFVFVGAGDVSVFTDGKRIDGRWNRPSLSTAPTLVAGGSVIELTPGRTWIELIGKDKGLLR